MYIYLFLKGDVVDLNDLTLELLRKRPNGISFEIMALRLLQRELPDATDERLALLKKQMFPRSDNVWLFTQQVVDDDTRREFDAFVEARLHEAAYLTFDALRLAFEGRLKSLYKPEDFMAFFGHYFQGPSWKGSQERNIRALQYSDAEPLSGLLKRDAARVSAMIDDAGGVLLRSDVLAGMPHVDDASLAEMMRQLAPEFCAVDIDGVPGWQKVDAVHLPDDFSEQLSCVMDLLLELDFKATLDNLNFALSMDYGIPFRKEYALENDELFRCAVEANYKGAEKICWKRHGARFARAKEYGEGYQKPIKTEKSQGEIIGVSGKPLKETVWRSFKTKWRYPHREEMAKMREEGVTIAEIAKYFRCSVGHTENVIRFHHQMPQILALNGMTEEDLKKPERRKKAATRINDDKDDGDISQQPTAKITKKTGETIEVLGMRGQPLREQSWARNVKIWKKRRHEVLEMLNKGMSKVEIAERLGLSQSSLLAISEMPKMLEMNGLTEEDLGV